MAQSAETYERRIYKGLKECSAQAKGLFYVMRYWSELNTDRPGFVERDGRPMSREDLAAEARISTSDTGPDPFHELRAVRDDDGKPLLLKQEGRTLTIPLVIALFNFRRRRIAATRKWHEGVSIDTRGGVNSRAVDTPVDTPPPPMVSPPITPSSLSPPGHTQRGREEANPDPAAGDDIDHRIRVYLRDHPRAMYSAVAHGNVRRMVDSAGWERMASAMDTAVANGAGEPTSYALQVLTSGQAKDRIKSTRDEPGPRRQQKRQEFFAS